jgi:hypothetical protein
MITQIEQGSKAVLRSQAGLPVAAQWQPSGPPKASSSKDFAPKWCAGTGTSDDSPLLLGCFWGLLPIRGDWVGMGCVGRCPLLGEQIWTACL